jgi:hypothetical protein
MVEVLSPFGFRTSNRSRAPEPSKPRVRNPFGVLGFRVQRFGPLKGLGRAAEASLEFFDLLLQRDPVVEPASYFGVWELGFEVKGVGCGV